MPDKVSPPPEWSSQQPATDRPQYEHDNAASGGQRNPAQPSHDYEEEPEGPPSHPIPEPPIPDGTN
jgi:hypothetical protein